MTTKKDSTQVGVNMFFQTYTQMLLDALVDRKVIIREDSNADKLATYKLVQGKGIVEEDMVVMTKNNDDGIISNFLNFRSILIDVARNLNLSYNKLSKAFDQLAEKGAVKFNKKQPQLFDQLFNEGEALLSDPAIRAEAVSLFNSMNMPFSKGILDLLDFFTRDRSTHLLVQYGYEVSAEVIESVDRGIDFIAKNKTNSLPDILFQVKYRRKSISADKDILYNATQILRWYNAFSGKENMMFMVIYSNDRNGFDRASYRFIKNVEDMFPEYNNKFFFIPVAIGGLEGFNQKLVEAVNESKEIKKTVDIEFGGAAKLIRDREEYKIKTDFLKSSAGVFAAWVKVPPLSILLGETKNNRYIIGHDTNNGIQKKFGSIGRYVNVFAVGVQPDKYGERPFSIKWRVSITDSYGEETIILSPEWKGESDWYHFFVRWNKSKPSLEFYINGELIENKTDFVKNWPEQVDNYAVLGNWRNLNAVHHLNMPLYRVVTTSSFLSDTWLKNELMKNKPTDSNSFL